LASVASTLADAALKTRAALERTSEARVGKEADVEARWPDGTLAAGRLQYEPPKLIFRGSERRVYAGDALAGVRADGRELILAGGERFQLPTPAQGWVEAILNPKGRLAKLGVKDGLRIDVVNLDEPDFAAELGAAAPLSRNGAALDLLFYGADSTAELAAIATLVPRLAERGALWVVSLKGKAARVKDVEVMAAAKACGLVDTKVCAFSAERTALKFVRRRT
jgi:hypothetical protein